MREAGEPCVPLFEKVSGYTIVKSCGRRDCPTCRENYSRLIEVGYKTLMGIKVPSKITASSYEQLPVPTQVISGRWTITPFGSEREAVLLRDRQKERGLSSDIQLREDDGQLWFDVVTTNIPQDDRAYNEAIPFWSFFSKSVAAAWYMGIEGKRARLGLGMSVKQLRATFRRVEEGQIHPTRVRRENGNSCAGKTANGLKTMI